MIYLIRNLDGTEFEFAGLAEWNSAQTLAFISASYPTAVVISVTEKFKSNNGNGNGATKDTNAAAQPTQVLDANLVAVFAAMPDDREISKRYTKKELQTYCTAHGLKSTGTEI
jgi:hypothetical protein